MTSLAALPVIYVAVCDRDDWPKEALLYHLVMAVVL